MGRFPDSPWTLRLAAIDFLAVIFIPFPAGAPTRPLIGAAFVLCLLLFFVLRGSRVAWVIALVGMCAGVIGSAFNGSLWEVVARAIALALIVLPASLAFVWRPEPR